MKKVVVIGATGQLGTDLMKALEGSKTFEAVGLTHRDIEIFDPDGANVGKVLKKISPDIVINTTAYHRVDEMEEYLGQALDINARAVHHLADICRELEVVLVHLSTDYVFGGDQKRKTPYIETDAPHPHNIYGISKLTGEFCVRHYCRKHFVIRTCGLYGHAGSSGKGGNFVETMLRLAKEKEEITVVNDQRMTPTFTRHLAAKILELIQTKHYGLYHMTSGGDATWYEFALEIFKLSKLSPAVSPCTTAETGATALRPAYSVLDNRALRDIGIKDFPHWRDALAEYIRDRGK